MVVWVLWTGGTAFAQAPSRYVFKPETNTFFCEELPVCEPNSDTCESDEVCASVAFNNGVQTYCQRPLDPLCCNPEVASTTGNGGCVGPGDLTGMCEPVSATVGLCVYPDGGRYCVPSDRELTVTALRDCYDTGAPSTTYFLDGDCDKDGINNAGDACPCRPGSMADGCPASTTAGVDGGVSADGATESTVRDGGQAEADDGSTETVQVVRDNDALDPPVDFLGDGGCACGVAHGGAHRALWSLLGLALYVLGRGITRFLRFGR